MPGQSALQKRTPGRWPGGAQAPFGTRQYDAGRSIYNLRASHFVRFRGALANARAGAGDCRIAAVGTSITAGYASSSFITKPWPVQLAASITSDGVPYRGPVVVPRYGDSGFDTRWTWTGSWDNSNPDADKHSDGTTNVRAVLRTAYQAAARATFTSTNTGTVLGFWYHDKSYAFSYSIDGGTAVNVTPGNTNAMKKIEVTGLTNAVHTLVIIPTGYIMHGAAYVLTTAAGLQLANVGQGSGDYYDLFGGKSGAWSQGQFPILWSAHLVTLNFGTNDLTNGTVAFVRDAAANAVNLWKTAGIDVLLVAEIPGSNYDMTPVRSAMYSVADQYDVPVLDMTDRWQSRNTANLLGLMADTLHPNDAGYAEYARAVRGTVYA